MKETKFSADYHWAVETVSCCVEQLNMLLDEKGKELLSALLEAQHTILSEQVRNRFFEGWHHCRDFSILPKEDDE